MRFRFECLNLSQAFYFPDFQILLVVVFRLLLFLYFIFKMENGF